MDWTYLPMAVMAGGPLTNEDIWDYSIQNRSARTFLWEFVIFIYMLHHKE